MGKKKILIAEDNTLLREGLRLMVHSDGRYEIVAEAGDGLSALRDAGETEPDLILLDLSMPKMNGISVIGEIKRIVPKTKVMALTIHDQEEYILNAFQEGADGYCLKSTDHAELMRAMETVLSGQKYISPGIAEQVLEGFIESRQTLKKNTSFESLTPREKEVLKQVGEGYSSREIADFLCISPKTVEKHRSNIMKKLGIRNAAGLTSYAIEKGLVVNPLQ